MPAGKTRTHVWGSVSDRLAAAAAAAVGRAEERARLTAMLSSVGPAVVLEHRPAGIAKTTLVDAPLAPQAPHCVSADGQQTAPTLPAALAALSAAMGGPAPRSAPAVQSAGADVDVDAVAIDSFEPLNLLDGLIGNEFIRAYLTEVDGRGRRFMLAYLDFGSGGLDAWIAHHIAAEPAEPDPSADLSGESVSVTTPDPPRIRALTAREQEVLALLAEGMTNKQLADGLFISERTANRHISNIFTKLGVHNRTQAARVAVDAGLAG